MGGIATTANPGSPSLRGPELFIGLVAALGTDHDQLTAFLEDGLRAFNYKTKIVRLAKLLRAFPRYQKLRTSPLDDYIADHQWGGDDFRTKTKNGAALGIFGITEIQRARLEENGDKEKIIERCAYIIRSLKTVQEVNALRAIYGNAFVLIGSSAPHQTRKRYLASKIAASKYDFRHDQYFARSEELIQKDQEEVGKKHGQNLRHTFQHADFFVDASDPNSLREAVERILDLVFGNTFHTPTRDEYGMFHARGAALRSAELGRQVGAAITTKNGDIIAVGTNEVPKAGGGLYWAGDKPDQREFVRGEDANDLHKRGLLEDLLNRLAKESWLCENKANTPPAELANQALNAEKSPVLREALITNLIEFGRAVHAEMAAISDAARRGVSVLNGTMYVTTFPCHLCAPVVVASGINRVVYIEPYAKSLAVQLYPDSIAVDGSDCSEGQIPFEPFVGIAPRRYVELFTALERKRDGKAIPFERKKAFPRLEGSPRSYIAQEKIALAELQKAIEENGLNRPEESKK
ncbi:MAG TPA: anti-phage dCTP deaminase [Candidatus Angelobacter sp.]|nr:anti-phage dCTP deaminase [Candidatus Angelobacter sp.]